MMICKGRISSPFGQRRDPILKTVRYHSGVDIAAPVGMVIYSPGRCVVVSVFTHYAGGKTLIMKSLDREDVRFGMCHLSAVLVDRGQVVEYGQRVAKSGNTGRSTGPHLHFSVKCGGQWQGEQYTGGQWVDPMPYLEIDDSAIK